MYTPSVSSRDSSLRKVYRWYLITISRLAQMFSRCLLRHLRDRFAEPHSVPLQSGVYLNNHRQQLRLTELNTEPRSHELSRLTPSLHTCISPASVWFQKYVEVTTHPLIRRRHTSEPPPDSFLNGVLSPACFVLPGRGTLGPAPSQQLDRSVPDHV